MRSLAVNGLGRFGSHPAACPDELWHEALALDVDGDIVQTMRGRRAWK